MGGTLALIVIGVIVLGVIAAVARKGYETTLRELGAPYGLAYERLGRPGVGHTLRGYVDGRPFELLVIPDGPGGVLSERWSIQMLGMIPGGFAAGKNGWMRGTSDGMVRLSSGDPAFDKQVMCEARNPHEAHVVLASEPRRAALRDLAKLNALVSDNQVLLHKSGFDNSAAKLSARLAALRAIAQCLDPVTPQVAPPQPMLQQPPMMQR